jgi:phosphomannomutase
MGIFKAYDVRGIYPSEIGEDVVRRIGNAFAAYLGGRGAIVVGRDMRPSSVPLSKALIDGITAAGADVIELGMCTTPMCYFATGRLEATGGIMVTASHNPAQYNGLKFCRERAIPVGSASGLGEIERTIRENGPEVKAPRRGTVRAHDVVADYAAFLKRQAGKIASMKVAIDTGNGSVGPFVDRCLGQFKSLEIVPMFFEPDGTFPNHEANPLKHENIEALIHKVRAEKCALGIAFDGDGDRCAFVDEKGNAVAGDMVTALIARRVLERKKGVVIYDLRSSRAVKEEIEKDGGTAVEERVGHAFIKATMRQRSGLFAGELSGHFYFEENFNAESAMLAAIRMLEIVSESGKPLGALVAEVDRYPRTGEVNFKIEDKDGALKRLEETFKGAEITYLDGITIRLKDWWVNVRKSNTEPLLRMNLEASSKKLLEEAKAKVIAAIGVQPGE